MGKQYEHLSLEDRCRIARLHEDGQSVRQIAAALDRPPSTISRELRRNRGKQIGYRPSHAHEQAKARRWTGSRLERDGELRRLVLDRLRHGWSPEQIAGRLACDKAATSISHESIYRFIYAQIRRTNDGSWRHYLPRAKAKRGWRGRKGGSPASFIQGRVSRILILARQPNKAAEPTARQLIAWLEPLPPELRQTITFDNGTEFAKHYRLKADLGIQTFFCDTHSPWQKGGIENAIGRMRRPLPRKTDLLAIRPKTLNAFVAAYNNTPRKCLDFQTPAEAFLAQLLHFKCESTSRLSPGRRHRGRGLRGYSAIDGAFVASYRRYSHRAVGHHGAPG